MTKPKTETVLCDLVDHQGGIALVVSRPPHSAAPHTYDGLYRLPVGQTWSEAVARVNSMNAGRRKCGWPLVRLGSPA